MIKKKSERLRKTYSHTTSNRFNLLINDKHLLDLSLSDRKYTWTKSLFSDSFGLLDRFLCILSWQSHFSQCIVSSLP
jgi:hypothetical protein